MVIVEHILWTTWLCLLAALVYVINLKKLSGWEWLILLIIGLNLSADFSANASQTANEGYSGLIYNLLAPIQRVGTLLVYAFNSKLRLEKKVNFVGIVLVVIISLIAAFFYPEFNRFHRLPYILSGCVVAGFSYFHLRCIILDRASSSPIIAAFCLANFVYLTLMVSSQSAVEFAYKLDPGFGKIIYLGNDIGYALWSVILIIGILWKKKQKI